MKYFVIRYILIVLIFIMNMCFSFSQVLSSPFDSMRVSSAIVSNFFGDFLTTYKEPFPPDDTQMTIYLTFDDGPDKGTSSVAHIAYEEKIPISFFMVGLHYEFASPLLLNQYHLVSANPFVQICNHSYSHAYRNNYARYYDDVKGSLSDILKNQQFFKFTNKIVRLPGSNFWATNWVHGIFHFRKITTLADSLFHLGFSILGWDDEWYFNYKTLVLKLSPQDMMQVITRRIKEKQTKMKNHFVLLMHERSFRSKESQQALISLIRMLKSQGFRFAFASNYPGLYWRY